MPLITRLPVAQPTTLLAPAQRLLGSRLLDALATPHGVQGYVRPLRAIPSVGGQRAELIAVRRWGAHSVTLTLRPSRGWNGLRAGQFIRLTVPVAGALHTRCYSPACAEQDHGRIEITLARHPAGTVSRHLYEHAHPGMAVGISDADGDFVLPQPRPEHLLMIAGGSGITPIMSMLRTLCLEGHTGAVTLLYYTPRREQAVYGPELGAIAARHPNVRIALVCTRVRPARGQLAGHISRGHLRRVAPDYRRAHTYACGPPGLLAWVRAVWAHDRIAHRLHIESFLPPSFATAGEAAHTIAGEASGPAGAEAAGSVRFARSHRHTPSDGRSLLEHAERAGLRPQCGCRMGICRMCTSHKNAGLVRNMLTGEVSRAEHQDIQICVSVPLGSVELAL